MTISSTEFQQNVGYYLKLAENNTVVTIQKSKPLKRKFTLQVVPQDQQSISKHKLKDLVEKVNGNKTLFKCYGTDSQKYVNTVRE